jgi:hypothetical protein
LAYGKRNSENLTKSADNRAKAGPVFSGNAELGYSLCLKAKSETRLVAAEVDKIYRHPLEVSNKKIGNALHTSLHNFATRSKLLKVNDSYVSSSQRYA